jgi:hypothetical protein
VVPSDTAPTSTTSRAQNRTTPYLNTGSGKRFTSVVATRGAGQNERPIATTYGHRDTSA